MGMGKATTTTPVMVRMDVMNLPSVVVVVVVVVVVGEKRKQSIINFKINYKTPLNTESFVRFVRFC